MKNKLKKSRIFPKLKAIMWKNCLVRRRCWPMIIVEVILPIYITLVIMIIQRSHLEYQFNNITSHSSSYSEEELYNKYFDNDMEIYYTPSISFIDELMENVTTLVQPKKVKKFSTEEELDSYYKNVGVKKESVMGIIFELKKDDIIRKCSYILRPYKRDFTWEVDNLFDQETSNSKKSGSRSYIEQSLLAVKMAIDSTYLNMMTSNEKLTINFTVQQFPYPPHESKELIHRMQRIILYTIMFSYTILCPIVLHKVVREQRTGIRNLMKIVGVKSWMLRLGWFLNFYILNLIAIFFITFCLVVPTCCTHAPFENSNPLILFMYLLLYGAAAIMFMLALGALSTKPLFIMSMGTFVWIMSFFVPLAIMKCNPDLRWFFRFVLLLLPNGCLLFGYMDIKDYEQEDIGIRWNNMSKHARVTTNVTLGTVIIMLIVDCIFYFFLALYVENVKRGKAKSIFLPCQALFKFLCESTEYDDDSDTDDDDDDNLERTQFFCKIMEKQNKTPIKIKLRNVTKSYKRVRVVRKLSMNIKEGQITVLVGRNGSGKTTILEIISGIVSATDGAVRVMNKTNDEETIELNVGYCPQSDVLFSNLNVLEHFIIFGMLKGLDRVEAEFEANELIFRLGLHLQSHNYGASVHEGTKRKVALGLALIGNPGTLLLDDPTAGLDPESRRSVWNLLLSLKGFKTVLLTTHSMKEADVLGDHIAIIDQGGLKCFGSPSYLKSKFAVGYYLSIKYNTNANEEVDDEDDTEVATTSKNQGNKEEEKEKEENKKRAQKILNHVLDVIPRGIFQSDDKDTLTVWIPYDSKPLLGKMFEAMEKSKTDLGIRKIDLDVTNSLEETVLRFERSLSEETVEEERLKKEEEILQKCVERPRKESNNGKKLCLQINALFGKRWIETKRSWKLYLLGLAIAILATLFTLILESKWINNFDGGPNTFYFDLHPYFKSKAYYTDSNDKNTRASAIAERYRNLVTKQDSQAIKTENVFQAILNESIGSLDSLVVAAEFNEIFEGNESRTVINALYSNNATHGAPISLNLVMNSVLQAIVNEDYSIQSAVNPFPKFRRTLKQIQFSTVITFWATLFPLGIFLFSSVFLMIPIVEKSSKSKHLQIMSGVNSITYWTTHYAWDLLIHTVMIFIIIWIVYLYGNVWYVPYNGISELGALALILAVYGVSIIPYAYLFSHKRVASVGFLTFIVINLIITFALTYHFIFPDFRHKFSKDVNLIKHIFFLYPQFGLTYASYQFSRQVDYNYNWETINATKGRKRSPETSSSADLRSYLSGQFPIGNILIIMFCSTLLYVILLTMLQTNIRRKFWDKMTNQYDDCDFSKIGRIRRYDVLWEQRRAETTYKIEKNSYKAMMRSYKTYKNADLFLAQNLQKNYKRKQVVWGISFGIKPGDSLGVVGINGVGKTTMLRILTSDLPLVCGDARVYYNNKLAYLSIDEKMYLKKIGYCPQTNAILPKLTGREMLVLTAKLYGIRYKLDELVNRWLTALDLQGCANVLLKYYSDGCKRKICIAMALIGNPLLILLDECTTGVDIGSRRKIWKVVKLFLCNEESQSSLIMTTNLMNECEAVCNKVAIMKPGRFDCFGDMSKAKNKYGNGYIITLYLKQLPNTQTNIFGYKSRATLMSIAAVNENSEEFNEIIEDFERMFSGICHLQEKHALLLEYRITDDSKTWTELYQKIENFQKNHQIIIDFTINRTSLEDALISAARS